MTAVRANAEARARTQIPRPGRIAGVDGIRGLAALYVVLHHIFERAWPGYPADHAPWWASELIYGRFAVVIFIALSGFSLGLGPARSAGDSTRSPRSRTVGRGASCRRTGPR